MNTSQAAEGVEDQQGRLGCLDPTGAPVLRKLVGDKASMEQCFETLLIYAASRKATDFFCNASRDNHSLYMRSEGTLYRLGDVPKEWGNHFIGHAKVMAQLRITEHRRPQDGRLTLYDGDVPIDMRIGTLPTFFGEELAIRILDRRVRLVDLDRLGMLDAQRESVSDLIHERSGLVLVSGRTGAGKTTTLYAILNELNDGTRKINTLEDPVECYIPGTYQSQVNPRYGQDFPDLLRALLRHAPDVIMVGEIRDPDTAKIAVQAAAAGQAVFATLHAPTAPQTIYSMLQLGTNANVLSTALRGVIAQDLLRKVCPDCQQPAESNGSGISFEDIHEFLPPNTKPKCMEGDGCEKCQQLGYQGQVAAFEVLHCTHAIRELIRLKESSARIRAKALEERFVPLQTSVKLALAKGLTSQDEALRILNDDCT